MRRSKKFADIVREFPDRGDQWLLESPENVRGLLLSFAADLAERLDFTRMQRMPTRFIAENLRKHEADLLYRIPYRTQEGQPLQEVFVYILIEPQSKVDPSMGFRLLLYMVNIWDQQRREWIRKKVPLSKWRFLPIIPVVFYRGSQRWDAPISIATLMDLPEELAEFIPSFSTLHLKLKAEPPEKLTESGHPFGWLLRVIQKEKSSEKALTEALAEAIEHFEELEESDRAEWEKLVHYLYLLIHHRRKPQEGQRLKAKIREGVKAGQGRKVAETMARNLAEQYMEEGEKRAKKAAEAMARNLAEQYMEEGEKRGIEKGEKRGIEKGIIRAKQDDLLGLIGEKFGPVPERVVGRVRALEDTETLDQLLKRLVHANSIEEMHL